jgi:hypothetical protein
MCTTNQENLPDVLGKVKRRPHCSIHTSRVHSAAEAWEEKEGGSTGSNTQLTFDPGLLAHQGKIWCQALEYVMSSKTNKASLLCDISVHNLQSHTRHHAPSAADVQQRPPRPPHYCPVIPFQSQATAWLPRDKWIATPKDHESRIAPPSRNYPQTKN